MSGSDLITNDEYYGQLKISEDVIAIIAGLAAVEVNGVYSMSGGITGGIAEVLGIKNLSKGIRVETRDDKVYINIYIIAEFGARIPEDAWNIQETEKKAVERMTGMKVAEANIHVQSVNIPRE